ncbi:hypothetical protein C8E89_1028 [Mycolicibacterium moriokaense]|uniref:Intersectin-EH binding protein Ibp1 n=1 Tax=Mycolicibacterium moriokaense TaxID=39691 RepID=A0A318HLV6_9MYCO|nr:hypothetical protein C8E89_1028 [Mycolicibacterium moriokaense]
MRTRSRVASLVATGATLGMLCTPAAAADPANTVCEPGQIVINGQCGTPPSSASYAPAPDVIAPAAAPTTLPGTHHH